MTIEALIKVVPPPVKPFEAFDGPWDLIEAALRTPLPQDYKDFVRVYGAGLVMELIRILLPRSRDPYLRLVSIIEMTCRTFRKLPDPTNPHRFWPEVGGLIPFGSTNFGDELFWLAEGAPDDWRVVVWDRGMFTYETFDCGMTDFLARVATGELLPDAFPEDILPCEDMFMPYPREDVR